jgi:hypothetical protein
VGKRGRESGRQAGRQASRLEEKGGVGWAPSFVRLAKTLPCLTSKAFFGWLDLGFVGGWVVGRRSWLFSFVLGLFRSREFGRVLNFSRVFFYFHNNSYSVISCFFLFCGL